MSTVTFVCGQLCSGKSHYAKGLAKACLYGTVIEVGDIVRKIKNTTSREALQDSKELSTQIISQLNHLIKSLTFQLAEDVIISGVRQKEILEAFPDANMIWISSPEDVRRARYEKRSRGGDDQTFEEANEGDIKLGILEVKQYILERQ